MVSSGTEGQFFSGIVGLLRVKSECQSMKEAAKPPAPGSTPSGAQGDPSEGAFGAMRLSSPLHPEDRGLLGHGSLFWDAGALWQA